jgi:hypothetical protein
LPPTFHPWNPWEPPQVDVPDTPQTPGDDGNGDGNPGSDGLGGDEDGKSVPEPGTILMLGAGLLLGARRLFRQR